LSNAVRLLIGAFCVAALGSIAFAVGIGAAFRRAGNWSNELAGVGVFLLICSGILAIAAITVGVVNSIRNRRLNWWLPLACLAAGLALWGGWVAINL